MADDKREIGARIRMIRLVKGMSQTTFAFQFRESGQSAGLATSTISSYEKGVNLPPENTMRKIAEIGEISIDDLLYGGSRFDDLIGNKAKEIENRQTRMRDDSRFGHSPSAGDIGTLIQRLKGFREFIDDVTGKLIKQEEQLSLPILSSTEKRLLAAFRALPALKQRRILEDTEEWASALGQGQSDEEE